MKKDHIIFLIGRIQYKANRFLSREMKARGIKGLAPSHGEILGYLMAREPLPMSEIGRIIDKDKSTITALVNKLIKLGYVEKGRDPADSRISLIALTRRGMELKPDFLLIAQKLRAHSYRGISDNERETLVSLLNKLNANL
ncbi:MAG: MarR family winged helix-turn-helix transcriptional regulator [Syntrophales bacterium]